MRLADDIDTSSRTAGDLGRYVEGRVAVLGRTCTITEDDDRTCEVLAAFFGGERRAAAALRRWLRQLDREGRRS